MKRSITNCVIALLSVALTASAAAQVTLPDPKQPHTSDRKVLIADEKPSRPLEVALSRFVDNNEIAGAVGLVADRDGVIAIQSVGLADIAGMQRMNRESIFWIASMSKPITGACIMMLQDVG